MCKKSKSPPFLYYKNCEDVKKKHGDIMRGRFVIVNMVNEVTNVWRSEKMLHRQLSLNCNSDFG